MGGAQKCAGRRVPRRCAQTTKPDLAPTLSFWVFHEHEEGEAQRSTQGLRAAKEQILCGHQQGIYVKVAQQVLHPCYLGKDAINEVSGRVGIEEGLVVADAASDEVLQAPEVQEKASVQHGHPVQEAWKVIAPLGVGQSLRGLEGLSGCVRVRGRVDQVGRDGVLTGK